MKVVISRPGLGAKRRHSYGYGEAAPAALPRPAGVATTAWVRKQAFIFRYLGVWVLFQFALKTITALLRLAVLQHCLRLRALFSFLMQIGISPF